MTTGLRRSFRPVLDDCRLESRVVLDATVIQAKAPVTPPPSVKPVTFHQTQNLLHAAYQSFLNSENQAQQVAVKKLASGTTDEATVLASLRSFTSAQGGVLAEKVAQIANRLPNGLTDLFNPQTGTQTTAFSNTGDPSTFVPAAFRLQTQINRMVTWLNAPQSPDTLQNALSQNAQVTILSFYQSSKSALTQFAQAEIQNGIFAVVP
jgi:hypothetical protein